jgi:hypothetical protein
MISACDIRMCSQDASFSVKVVLEFDLQIFLFFFSQNHLIGWILLLRRLILAWQLMLGPCSDCLRLLEVTGLTLSCFLASSFLVVTNTAPFVVSSCVFLAQSGSRACIHSTLPPSSRSIHRWFGQVRMCAGVRRP